MGKNILFVFAVILFGTLGTRAANSKLLPENLPVWVTAKQGGGEVVINYKVPGSQERILPVYNDYRGNDGGYVAVYTRKQDVSVYQCGKEDIYIIALLRVPGHYEGTTFVPKGYKRGQYICKDAQLLQVALKYLDKNISADDIWFGGDTGGFVGH